jgi:hypothetical protein
MKALPLQKATIDIQFRSNEDIRKILNDVRHQLEKDFVRISGSSAGHRYVIEKGIKEDVSIQEINGNTCVVIQSKINKG